ncbi:SurA N-terminal domain-containing protein [Granulicella sp. L46]|jgi:peptidyl-prolyl cis-trans isomerase SurA|uniref:SurA N-terminal domain-containing protein n=1 Tax=Granulicella sp. L46 TaxID=1641865 RepID=UPI00131BEEE3|nr:SurA N-terminal domain-containing protein [Granulicella sp. L46]
MPKSVRTFSIFIASSLVLIAGCHKGPQQGVVATVNGHPIFQTDVDKAYTNQLATNPQQQVPTPDQADSLRLNIIHAQILEAILDQRAAKQGLTATDAEVEAKLAEMKAPYTEEQFQAKLKTANLTLDELKREIRRNLTQEKLLNKEINSRITVTDLDVRNYYDAHKADFNLIEPAYHLAQIIVTDQGNAQSGNLQNNKATSAEDARKKIQAIKTRIDSGEDFGELAANFSEDTGNNQNGGDMGFLPESQLKSLPVVYAAITKLNAGQTTDIIPKVDPTTHKPVAYAIFKLISKDAAGQRQYDDPRVQQSIRQQLHESRAQLLQAAYREMLIDQAKVENFFAEQVFKRGAQ